jgi:hypothetical protein
MVSALGCSQCCAIFSFAAIWFLIIIASLLHTQPLYIKGPTDTGKASTACYNGAWIYFGTFMISVLYWGFHGKFQSAVIKTGVTQSSSQLLSNRNYGAVIADEDDMHD